jgi:gluconate 5-dehydrogenase
MDHPFSLEGRSAVVTGSTRGLGLAIARALGSAGATVAVNGRDAGQVAETCRALGDDGILARPLPFDVADTDVALGQLDRFRDDQGSLDILVHNAGHGVRADVLNQTIEDWQAILDVHLTAGFLLGREAARHMIGQGWGRIIFISSILASIGRHGAPSYSAAKGGLNALVRMMAAELGPSGITVNAIAPGYFATEMTSELHENAEFNTFVGGRTPVGRWGRSEEIGWAALYLASDAAAYVNGHVLTVDGGMSVTLGA